MVIDYSQGAPPEYKCSKCGVTGVKLWRWYGSQCPALVCAECASHISGVGSGVSISVDDEGMHTDELGERTDKIGGYIPAYPTQDGKAYWGYQATKRPNGASAWWKRLATRVMADPTKPLDEALKLMKPEPAQPPLKRYTKLKGRKILW